MSLNRKHKDTGEGINFFPGAYLMYKLIFLFLFSMVLLSCRSQERRDEVVSPEFRKYVLDIISDSTKQWSEYPTPPALTDEVLEGLSKELQDDSTKYFFEKLSISNMKSHADYKSALDFFEKHSQVYTTLAATAHWNPDTRIEALKSVSYRKKIRPMVCTTKEGYEKLEKDDFIILKFLIYLLESNPVFISGSENATIHSIYMSNIAWNLDLHTKENITDGKVIWDWYKNGLHYQSLVNKWKEHLSNKK